MDVVIPTYRRATREQQITYTNLRWAGVRPILAVRESEISAYKEAVPEAEIVLISDKVLGIGDTRDEIIAKVNNRFVLMMDDDLDFAVRRKDDPTKMRAPTPADINDMLVACYLKLKEYAHVSVAPREGSNRSTDEFLYNTRMMRVLGYDTRVLKDHLLCFSPAQFMCDFHMTLQLLRLGYDGCVINNFTNNQRGGSNAPGGCSTTRSDASQTAEANWLAARHPGFVRVVQKATKTAWGGGIRTDVTVQWKQARKAGVLK